MRYRLLLVTAMGLTSILGCQTAHMPVPGELAGANRLAVSGRQGLKVTERLVFGPYDVAEIDRSWTTGRDQRIQGYEGDRREQRFSFVVRENGEERLGGSCRATVGAHTLRTDVVDIELSNRSSLFCSLFPSREAARDWELRLEESGDRPLKGSLEVGDTVYDVTGTRKLQGPLPAETTTGYEIADGGRIVAAVEVIGDGAVVLAPNLEAKERALIATTAAALLLVEDLRSSLPGDN